MIARLFSFGKLRRACASDRRGRLAVWLFYLNALYRAVGGGGFAGLFLAGGHGAFRHGFVRVHFKNFGAVIDAKAAAYAGISIYCSFHVNTSVLLLLNLS